MAFSVVYADADAHSDNFEDSLSGYQPDVVTEPLADTDCLRHRNVLGQQLAGQYTQSDSFSKQLGYSVSDTISHAQPFSDPDCFVSVDAVSIRDS